MGREVGGGSAWGTHVHPWQIHVNVWQNQYDIVKYINELIFKKESACNAEDSSSIPGSERSTGEGIRYPLQYSWASLVAQLVKNLPAMRETLIRFLGQEDQLEKGKASHSSISAWRIVHGITKSLTEQSDFRFQFH